MCDKCWPYSQRECNKQFIVPQSEEDPVPCKLQPDHREGCRSCPRHVPPPIECGITECPKKTECKECKPLCPDQDEPGEFESGCFTWCKYGIFILFTTPVTPVQVKLEEGSPFDVSLCLELKKNTSIPASFFKAFCHTNIICDENPKGETVDLCMKQNISLSDKEGETHTHIFQRTIVPRSGENTEVKFKVHYRNLIIWAGACPRAALCTRAEKMVRMDCKHFKDGKKGGEDEEEEDEEMKKRKEMNCGQLRKKIIGSEESFSDWLTKRRANCLQAI